MIKEDSHTTFLTMQNFYELIHLNKTLDHFGKTKLIFQRKKVTILFGYPSQAQT